MSGAGIWAVCGNEEVGEIVAGLDVDDEITVGVVGVMPLFDP